MIYDKGNGYLIQVQFGDGTWCNVTVEDTFKKEGAQIYLENRHVKGDNKLFHTQRFRIEEKRHGGYYIRSMDGRFLRYDYKKREVNFTATRPGDYSNDREEQSFTWYILTSRRRSWMD